MKIAFHFLMAMGLGLLASCSGGDDDSQAKQQTAQLQAFNTAQGDYLTAAEKAHAAACDAVRTASYDFAGNVATTSGLLQAYRAKTSDLDQPANETEELAQLTDFTGDFDDALAAAVLARREALASAYEWLEAVTPLEIGADTASTTAALTAPGAAFQGARIGKRESPLVFVALGALVGAVLLNKALHETMEAATDTRTKPLRDKIEKANDSELEVIKEEMGIKASATKEETLKEIKKRPAHKRLEAVKKAEAGLAVASVEKAEVEMVDPEEVMQSVSSAAVKCGETAATQVAGWWTAGAGGQGVGQVVEAISQSALLATMVDISVTVAGVQPLDLFAKTVSKAKKKQTIIPAPETTPDDDPAPTIESAKEAVKVLRDEDATADKVKAAADKVGEEMMTLGKVSGTTESDGSITAELPEQTFIGKVDAPSATTVVQMPNFGPSDVLVSAPDRVPQLFEDVDTGATPAPTLAYDNETIGDFVKQLNTPPDGGAPEADGGTGNPTGGTLGIRLPMDTLRVDTDFTIKVDCAATTAFPATLDVSYPVSASVAWGSRIQACPIDVIYSNSATGTQDLSFKLTDAKGAVQTATASPVLFDGNADCDSAAAVACKDTYSDVKSATCMATCDGQYSSDTELRLHEICYMSCQREQELFDCNCAAANACLTLGGVGWSKTCCMSDKKAEYVDCLRQIDSGLDPNYLGDCRPLLFAINTDC